VGLLPRLAAVLTRDDVEHPKAWPDVLPRAAAAIGIAPAICVAVVCG
jgi:beta-phosphoglucomutase-like phosphatase (HAD superfamily)